MSEQKPSDLSLPVREVWIEIADRHDRRLNLQSLPVREVWIEILSSSRKLQSSKSLPVREVWIEIVDSGSGKTEAQVTSREGSVD